MIQLLRQRYLCDPKTGKYKKPMFFLKPCINAESVQDLFFNLEKYIEEIPEKERYNLHYTLCECHDDKKTSRIFKQQNVIPFDIDGMDISKLESYIGPVLEAIGNLNRSDVGIVCSGRGLHFLVGTTETIEGPDYFEKTRHFYKLICKRINLKLKNLHLPGECDSGIWAAGHTLRLPGTMNIKTPELGYKVNFTGECYLITKVINLLPEVTVKSLSGGEDIPEEDYVKIKGKSIGGRYPTDTQGVLSECSFLKFCDENQESVREPQWYAMLSIVSHLENGRELAHKMSSKHPDYSPDETDLKVDQAHNVAGPRTCDNISTLWEGCEGCEHHQKITSPITIKSQKFIKTRGSGFRQVQMKTGANGTMYESPGKIEFEDLRRFFEEKHPYVSTDSKVVYIFNGTHWEHYPDIYLEGFCQDNVSPAPTHNNCQEFKRLIFRTNLVKTSWFNESTFKKLNLKNGILDLSVNPPVLTNHSKDLGFMSVLDYDYDPEAECPRFDAFMNEITLERSSLKDVLLEFAGYAFSNDKCVHAKALILLGEGSNGKSTFLNILTKLAGDNAYSSLSTYDLINEQQRAQLQGKLFNLSEETPTKSFVDSSVFKNIVSGGSISVKMLYKDPFSIRPRAKLMMAANELPITGDVSKGFLRRLLIVPFDAEFSNKKGNRDIRIEDRLEIELPGILNRVIEGFQQLDKNKKFTDSKEIQEEIFEYRDSIDPVIDFVRENLKIDELSTSSEQTGTAFSKIHKAYIAYCEENYIRERMNSNHFARRLKSVIGDYKLRLKRKTQHKVTIVRGLYLIEGDLDF